MVSGRSKDLGLSSLSGRLSLHYSWRLGSSAYRTPPGRLPTTPSAMNSTDRAKAAASGTPTCAKTQTNAAWPVPSPLNVIGQQHDQQDQRDEREVGRERRRRAQAPAETVRLQDAQDLHGDRGRRAPCRELARDGRRTAEWLRAAAVPRAVRGRRQARRRQPSRAAAPSTRVLKTSSRVSRQAPPAAASDARIDPVAAPAGTPAPTRGSAIRSSDTMPSMRSMNTDATASPPRTRAREAAGPHRIAADARQKRAEEGADEKDAQDRRERRDAPPGRACRAARSSDTPSRRDRRARAGRRAASGRQSAPERRGEHLARVALPEDIRGQAAAATAMRREVRTRRQRSTRCGLGRVFDEPGRIVLDLVRAHQELRVRHDLLHRADVDLAGAEARRADLVD